MKLFFTNNKYLIVDNVCEEYREDTHYLTFSIINNSISFDSLKNFFTTPNNLTSLSLVNDKNVIIKTYENVFNQLNILTYNFSETTNLFINVQLIQNNN